MWSGGELERIAPGRFDHAIDPRLAAEFAADPRHHLALALDDDVVVGMAPGVHCVHPDKPAELWINEVGGATDRRGRGIGKGLLDTLLATQEAAVASAQQSTSSLTSEM